MKHLSVSTKDGQLVIRHLPLPYILAVAWCILGIGLLLVIPLIGIFKYHSVHCLVLYRFFRLSASVLLLTIALVYGHRAFFRTWIFVFDRPHDYVTLNGKEVGAMSDLRSIHLEKEYFGRGNKQIELSAMTHENNKILIERDDSFGASLRELEQVGKALADYAGIMLIKPDF